MKKLFTLLVLALMVVVMTPDTSKASHMAGVDITYEYAGSPNTFLVRLKFYRDCLGISAPTQVTICYSSVSTGQNGSVIASQVSTTPVPSTPCVNAASSCPGGVGDIEEYVYETIVTLPGPAVDWIFSWADCCRNGAITTLQPNGMYISALLDNVNAPTNSSPSFLNLAYTRFCVGNQFYYDQGATDIDGDSLVFTLVTAEDGGFGCPNTSFPNTYIAPYSATNFLASSIPITINQNTGVINFIPSVVQVAVMCVLVEEYRNGLKIGSVKRDIQINIVPACNQIIPSFINSSLTTGPGIIQTTCGGNDYTIIVPFDTTFQCGSAVPTDFRVITPIGIPNPVVNVQPINCSNGQTDSLLLTLLNPLISGTTYVYLKKGFDGNTLLSECGAEMPELLDTVKYIVLDSNIVWLPKQDSVGCAFNNITVQLMDSIYCNSIANDGSDLYLIDGNGVNYPIGSVYGFCTPGGLKTKELLINMASTVSSGGPFYLLLNNSGSDGNTLANTCGRYLLTSDTIAIFGVDTIIPVNLGTDQSLCSFDPVPTLDCGYTGFSIQWYDQNGPIAGATSQTYTPTVSGTYSVYVSNGPTCAGNDTMSLVIIPAPTDNLPADASLCINDPLPTLDAGNPGATYQWYANNVLLPGETNQTYTPNPGAAGTFTYSVEVNTGNVVCIGDFDVTFTVVSAYTVSTLSDQSICANGTYPLLDAGNPGANYQWNDQNGPIAGATSQTYQTTQAGTYSVTVGSGSCAGTGQMVLTVNAIPTPALTSASICDYDAIPTLDAGAYASATYQWNDQNGPIAGATAQTYTPTGAGTYSVDVTIPPGCTGSSSMSLTVNAAPLPSVADADICTDQQATLDAGVAGASYQWSNGGNTQTISTNVAGTYSVLVTLNNCTATDTAVVNVFAYPVAPIVACNPGTGTFKFIYTWSPIAGAASYEVSEDGGATWIPANTPTGPETHGLNITIPNFAVRAIGSGLCKIGASSEPIACEVVIPNIFTPNGDNVNEFFEIDNIEQYPNNNVQIFNRWGKEVYSVNGYNNSNKKFDGKDSPDGVYFYIVDLADGTEPKSGTVTISR
jgi:gliding motility-associated-like protein